MNRISIEKDVYIPMPVTIVGANVEGKPNFMTAVWVSRVNSNPPMIAVAIGKEHYTSKGIFENNTFSINIPAQDLLVETDYCGLISGKERDKSQLFDTCYGVTGTAPMIRDCPISMECKLVQTVDLPDNTLFIGEIVRVAAFDVFLRGGSPDYKKIHPIIMTMPDSNYWSLGTHVGDAHKIGKHLKVTV